MISCPFLDLYKAVCNISELGVKFFWPGESSVYIHPTSFRKQQQKLIFSDKKLEQNKYLPLVISYIQKNQP